jgi:site-specific DNA recombinase
MKVGVYARNSTIAQAERRTTEDQLAFLRDWAALHGHDIVEVYTEEAISGKTPMVQRPEGLRMLRDAGAKRFDVLAVYRLDRFGRSTLDTLEALKTLKDLGVGFISATESFGNDPDGQLFLTISAAFAERERQLIIQRTAGGRQRAAREGRWTGGKVPYGYDVLDQRLVISTHPVPRLGCTEAELVVDLFERLAAGSTVLAESKRLNGLGVPSTRNGNKLWREGKLLYMYHSRVYLGQHAYKAVIRAVPPLIDQDLWDRVQAQLRKNLSRRRSEKRFNLLRGLIRCETCGGTFVCAPMSTGRYYYRCSGTLEVAEPDGRRCNASFLRAETIEALVWDTCQEMLDHPEMIEQLEMDTLLALEERDANRAAEMQTLRHALGVQAAERDLILRQLRKGHLPEREADIHLDEIRSQEARLQAELSRFEDQRSLAAAHLQRIREAERVINACQELTDTPERRRMALEALFQGMSVRTLGTGRGKKAQITMRWLGQEPYIHVPLKDVDAPTSSFKEIRFTDKEVCPTGSLHQGLGPCGVA